LTYSKIKGIYKMQADINALRIDVDKLLKSSGLSPSSILEALISVDGAGSGLDADKLDGYESSEFLLNNGYTASDILSKLLTVDGAGCGLDADKLDGVELSTIYSKYDPVYLGVNYNLNNATTNGM